MTSLLRLFGYLGGVAAIFAATFVMAQPRLRTIAVEQLRPGMKGYGLTVFRGTQPERFEVELIDVLHNFRPDQDLILVKTKHPSLQHAKIVAGMSGSPIYFDGRLAGAYAYAWNFGRDPVAGVTPIKNMMAELRRPVLSHPPAIKPLPQRPSSSATRAVLPPFPYLGQQPREALFALKSIGARRITVHDSRVPGLKQATTPLMVGGLHEATLPWLSEQLEPLGLVPLQAGGASKTSTGRPTREPSSKYVDGGAIAVELATGDISMSGTGTVTYVDGRRVLAFGHPMLDAGEVGLPTATARVLHIFASYMRSFKIAESVHSLGALVHDRQSTIVIDTQTRADTIPVKLIIDGLPQGLRKEWNVQIANHRMLTPLLVMVAAMNALKATVNDVTDIMYTVKSRVDVEGYGIQEVEDLGYTDAGLGGLGFLGGIRLFSLVEAAYANPYEAARINGIELRVSLKFDRNVTHIIRAAISSDEVDPGASLPVYVTLKAYGEPERTKVITVDIPERAAGRKVELVLEPGNTVEVEQPVPRNLDDLLHIVRNRFAANTLIASVKMPTHGLRLHGHVAHDLPGSTLDILQPSNVSSRPVPFMSQIRRAIDFDTVLTGSARLKLEVREVAKK